MPSGKHITREIKQRIMELKKEKVSTMGISKRLGLAVSTINKVMKNEK